MKEKLLQSAIAHKVPDVETIYTLQPLKKYTLLSQTCDTERVVMVDF